LIFCLKSDNTILFSGCAHSGVLNILSSFKQFIIKKPGIVIGGFHLPDSNSSRPYETAEDLRFTGKSA
jgi:7,8-dihydropterin-6-yl-methyl-4-(beta-D-ribofuranosyl)aminobenzene 5'-phosphate synthase